VDSAAETAMEVAALLETHDIQRHESSPPSHHFAASDAPLRFRDVGRTFIGDVLAAVEHVDLEGRAA
jgi:glutamate racemase